MNMIGEDDDYISASIGCYNSCVGWEREWSGSSYVEDGLMD